MIARFRVLFHSVLSVRAGDVLEPYEYSLGDYRVKVYPPLPSGVNPSDLELSPLLRFAT